ncbi:hypothetical protein Barb4_03243 [Bacteroidales bacterium Barb4]|nr:hypothetical protein Barb4_03243 [Bacteroidales bacterium Barb4]
MQRSGMWGLRKGRPNGVLKERPNITYICCIINIVCICIVLSELPCRYCSQTPHSAALHVGLKSGALSGLPIGGVLMTPHSATLHVGLKSAVLSGLFTKRRKILRLYMLESAVLSGLLTAISQLLFRAQR